MMNEAEPRGEVDRQTLLPAPDAVRYNYGGRCWWCGGVAGSREHKYKRSDLVREFGAGSWKDSGGVVRVRDGQGMQDVQGAGSESLTFPKVLCMTCNNARSQAFDRSYDAFAEYFCQNEAALLSEPAFDLRKIYGHDWRTRLGFLVRYWVKHICCRLAEGGVRLPDELIGFMDGRGIVPPHLRLQLRLWAEFVDMVESCNVDVGGFGTGDLEAEYSKSRQCITTAWSNLSYRSLRLDYYFELDTAYGWTNLDGPLMRLRIF